MGPELNGGYGRGTRIQPAHRFAGTGLGGTVASGRRPGTWILHSTCAQRRVVEEAVLAHDGGERSRHGAPAA